jgi:hypothetical protein
MRDFRHDIARCRLRKSCCAQEWDKRIWAKLSRVGALMHNMFNTAATSVQAP